MLGEQQHTTGCCLNTWRQWSLFDCNRPSSLLVLYCVIYGLAGWRVPTLRCLWNGCLVDELHVRNLSMRSEISTYVQAVDQHLENISRLVKRLQGMEEANRGKDITIDHLLQSGVEKDARIEELEKRVKELEAINGAEQLIYRLQQWSIPCPTSTSVNKNTSQTFLM